jgi:hypothetical protein
MSFIQTDEQFKINISSEPPLSKIRKTAARSSSVSNVNPFLIALKS